MSRLREKVDGIFMKSCNAKSNKQIKEEKLK